MKQYLECLKYVKENGVSKTDRTGTGTISCFGYQNRYDLSEGFPLVTTKKTFWRGIVHELLWFISGDTNIKYLLENDVHIWDEWADENGDLGSVYGEQWRSWQTKDNQSIDQLQNVIEQIKNNPDSRRHLVVAYNPGEVDKQALPPCHSFFQFYVANNKLSCQLYQRSADLFLGVPFNIASYALLTMMIAHVCNLEVGDFVHTFGDLHIYNNHFAQIDEQLTRKPYALPTVKLNPAIKNIDDFKFEDIELIDYISHPAIKGAVSV